VLHSSVPHNSRQCVDQTPSARASSTASFTYRKSTTASCRLINSHYKDGPQLLRRTDALSLTANSAFTVQSRAAYVRVVRAPTSATLVSTLSSRIHLPMPLLQIGTNVSASLLLLFIILASGWRAAAYGSSKLVYFVLRPLCPLCYLFVALVYLGVQSFSCPDVIQCVRN